MNTTKHIIKLAEKLANESIKNESWYKQEDFEWLKETNIKHLNELKEALLKGRYYTSVDSVSSSGMSRTIKIKYIKNNQLNGVTEEIYSLAGCNKNRSIKGCGMDMLFHAQYNLFQALCPNLDYSKKMKRYNNL